MADFSWRGRSSGALYVFDRTHIPPALLDQSGSPTTGTYNAETLIVANRDGSVQQPFHVGPPPGDDPYAAYVHFTDWFNRTS